jgi:hypothetical protein
VKWVLLLVAFVAGAGLTWLLTVHRVTRDVPVGGAPDADDRTEDDASGFGGPSSGESSGVAGARWMRDAQDEDALLPDAGLAPVEDASPMGDVAGLGHPEATRALDAGAGNEPPAGTGTDPGTDPGSAADTRPGTRPPG